MKTKRVGAGAALLVMLCVSPAVAADAVRLPFDVPFGTWREIPGTKLKDAWASWGLPEHLPQGSATGASAIITAWNSGALDTKRGVFVIPRAGGHADWGGNQVVGFNLKDLKWQYLRPFSPNYPPLNPSNPKETYINPYSDGTPASVHTYDAVEYLPTVDRIWSAGGIYHSPGGESSPPKTWWWNPTSTEWETKVTRPGGYGTSSRWLKYMERLLVRTSKALYTYDPAADSYKEQFKLALPGDSSTLAVDETERKVYRVVRGKLSLIDMRDFGGKERLESVTGDTPFMKQGGIPILFDRGRLIVFGVAQDPTRGTVFVIDPATRVASRHEPKDDTLPPRPTRQGMWKRFFEYGGYYWAITQWHENVWVFNPGPQGVTVVPGAASAAQRAEAVATTPAAASAPPRAPEPAAPALRAPKPVPPVTRTPEPARVVPARASSTLAQASPEATPARGPGLDIANRTWVALPQPSVGAGPSASRGKHMRLLHDSKRGRMVLTGGDYPYTQGDGNALQLVWAIDLAKGPAWELLHGWCSPPGGVQPARPDNVTWVYDSKRDQGIVMPAYYFGPAKCPDVAEAKDAYLFDFATNAWKSVPWSKPAQGYGGDLHNHFGVYDPVTDSVYRFYMRGALNIQILDRGTNKWDFVPLRGSAGDASNDQPAIDVKGRNIYVISRKLKALLRYSIDKGSIAETIPLPEGWVGPTGEFGGSNFETYLAFDPINRVLMNPVTTNYGGKIRGVGLYHPDDKRWEWEPPVEGVSGNTLGFDATNNVFLFLGRSESRSMWLYRYGPGRAPR